MNKRNIGASYEGVARDFLTDKGYEILCMNYRCKYGEIDIIARDNDGYVVFVEVKYRSGAKYGMPYEAVTKSKQKTIFMCSEKYLQDNKLSAYGKYRFDVISIKGNEIQHIKNAFGGL